jgi:hypothetical protein
MENHEVKLVCLAFFEFITSLDRFNEYVFWSIPNTTTDLQQSYLLVCI